MTGQHLFSSTADFLLSLVMISGKFINSSGSSLTITFFLELQLSILGMIVSRRENFFVPIQFLARTWAWLCCFVLTVYFTAVALIMEVCLCLRDDLTVGLSSLVAI